MCQRFVSRCLASTGGRESAQWLRGYGLDPNFDTGGEVNFEGRRPGNPESTETNTLGSPRLPERIIAFSPVMVLC
jgi:hypothetical protein